MMKELPNGWKWEKIGDIAIVNPKLQNSESISADLKVQFLPMKLVEENINKIHLTETRYFGEVKKGSYMPFIDGDLIFAKVTPCMENGKVAVIHGLENGIGYGSSEFHVLRCNNEAVNKYVFYFIVQDKFRNNAKNAMTGAVGLRRVPKKFIENYQIPIPPKRTQQFIVSKLEEIFSELDKGIENLRSAQQQLKTYRQSVLKWAFEGKLNKENVKEDEMPKGWKWEKLGNVCDKIQDGSHFSPQVQYDEPGENRFKYITAKNIRNGYMDFRKLKYVDRDFHDSIYGRCNPEFGDVLLTKDGINTGEVTLNTLHEPFSLLSSVCIFKTKKKDLKSEFLQYFIQSPFGTKAILDSMTGTAIKRIVLRKIKDSEIVLPPVEEQHIIIQEIESRLSVADKMEESIIQSLHQSEALRQSVLKKAFEGKLMYSKWPN